MFVPVVLFGPHRKPTWGTYVFWGVLGAALVGVVLYITSGIRHEAVEESSPAVRPPGVQSRPVVPAFDWPAFQMGGGLLGEAPHAPAPPLKLRWTFKAEGAIEGSAAVVGNTVYVGDMKGNLYAINLRDGSPRWRYKADGGSPKGTRSSGFPASPLVWEGRVYIGDDGGTFHAVDAATGQRLWQVETEAEIHSSANVVLAAAVPRHEVETSAATQPWRAEGPPRQPPLPRGETLRVRGGLRGAASRPPPTLSLEGRGLASPAAEARIVFGSYDNHLYGVDARTGEVVWKHETDNYVHCTPAVESGLVYIAGCDARLTAVDAVAGDVRDTADLGAYTAAAPLVLPDLVVAATMSGKVLAFSRPDLTARWEYAVEEGTFYSSPAYAEGLVVVGGRDGKVHAIDALTGAGEWTFAATEDVDSSPTIAGKRVYVGGKDGRLYVLDLITGERLWAFEAGRQIVASPALTAEAVVVGDTGGNLYCLEAK